MKIALKPTHERQVFIQSDLNELTELYEALIAQRRTLKQRQLLETFAETLRSEAVPECPQQAPEHEEAA